MEWVQIKELASKCLDDKSLSDEYKRLLTIELSEIERQGANSYWEDCVNNKEQWNANPNGLVLPFVLGMTQIDPVKSGIKHIWKQLTDFPDVDLDFLPLARQTIKDYATKKYVHVCSVGNWITYKPKSALQDVVRALGGDQKAVVQLTKNLPDEFDEYTIDGLLKVRTNLESLDKGVREDAHRDFARFATFYEFWDANKDLVDKAFRMVGKIKAQGTHAGGIIIADRPIENIIPLSQIKGVWTSQWTEGRSTQLSKFGLVKYDILGVKTIYYIWQAGNLIKSNRGITIDWSEMDPIQDLAGHEIMSDGSRKKISLNDELAFKMCNELRTDSVFQIESDIQKGIIKDGGVKTFWDLVVYNAMGRPGPMDMIPEYIKRRDDPKQEWKKGEDPRIIDILGETFGIICYQEQLSATWIKLARFSLVEAEEARKIVSKKWVEKLPQIEKKWKSGASNVIGEQAANAWWEKMVFFGRYCFNKSHALAYSLITYRCLYLKAHYPAEWWAAVMTECHRDKLGHYMSAAKLDGVEFGTIDINNLTQEFTVLNGRVIPGLKAVKGVGGKAAEAFTKIPGPFINIDDMISKCGKHKIVFERLIKLGAFDKLHSNRRGLWVWYKYKYCSGSDIRELKKQVDLEFAWPEQDVLNRRVKLIAEYKQLNPKKKKIPVGLLKWRPKPILTREQVINLFNDYDISERLVIEKNMLGYYWSSPLLMYHTRGFTIKKAKEQSLASEEAIIVKIEAVVEKVETKRAKASGSFFYIMHLTDGVQVTDVVIWADVYNACDRRVFGDGAGVEVDVVYNKERESFRIANGSVVIPLLHKTVEIDDGVVINETVKKDLGEDLLW